MGRYTAAQRKTFKRNQPANKRAPRRPLSAGDQAAALRKDPATGSITGTTPTNPYQKAASDATAYGTSRAVDFEKSIADQTARETTGVIAQQRDEGDIGNKRIEESAMAAGAGRVGAGSYAGKSVV